MVLIDISKAVAGGGGHKRPPDPSSNNSAPPISNSWLRPCSLQLVYTSMYNIKHLFDGCIVNLTEVFIVIIAINNMLLQIAVK